MTTDYHSQYWAHALTLKSASDSIDNLSRSISNARVDLNPHQVDAALFAFRSPLSRGVILADEVGLGKTIEAGIVISQRWAERHRQILLILPATLRKQWQQEMEEKFFLPVVILEARNFNQMRRDGHANPFDQPNKIVACSYNFASAKVEEIRRINWDLVVIDEAHRLRNVYKTSNKMARNIADAIGHCQKLLLTATPLQNTLMELFGLVSVIDPQVFGDPASFREQFVRANDEANRNLRLRERIKPLCTRTLRQQVLEYIRFTHRVPITQEFLPTDQEHRLYREVSTYLQRDLLLALPASQRMLMTMVLRKLLASSTFAIAATLRRLVGRLENIAADQEARRQPLLDDDYEAIDEVEEEWEEGPVDEPELDLTRIREELEALCSYAELAEGIQHNAKGDALLSALKTAFNKAHSLGAREKAVIFTESRRTQEYLFDLLNRNGYAGKVVMLNGTNADAFSRQVYDNWRQRHEEQEVVSGSRAVDTKAAIVEEFRDRATLIRRAIDRRLPIVHITFDYQAHGARIAAIEKYIGSSGWLELSKLSVESFEVEEFLVFAAKTDTGKTLDSELCRKLLSLPGTVSALDGRGNGQVNLDPVRQSEAARLVKGVDDRNGRFFDEEVAKLERWSDDLKLGLEREIKDLDQQIKEIRRETQAATALTEKLAAQKKLKTVESERNRKRRELYDAEDAIDRDRDELIAKIEKQLSMEKTTTPLFVVRWGIK